MQNSGLTCGTEGLRAEQGAQPYTRPTTSHANPLFRTRAISSARGPAIPSLGDPAHMRNSGLTCGTAGLRAGQRAQPYTRPATSHANPLFRTRAISSAREPAIPNPGHLIRTWTRYSEPGRPRPHAEQRVNMRNSGFTCGTRWTPSRCRARMIRHESWGSRTRPRCFSIYISEACTTTCNRDFPSPASRRVTTPATRSVLNTNSRRSLATSETSYRTEEIIAQGKPESACAGRPRRSRTCPVPRTAS